MFKVYLDGNEYRSVATIRLAWGVIDREYHNLAPGEALDWGIEAFSGSFHRDRMTRDQWKAFAKGPLAFQKALESMAWQDRVGFSQGP
ncbi:hypothetical protein [Thiohalorhabdus methylotrophus]|uniref:Uncharacterized protein n=1 Tax=Thiohalorhabdus methylotrophus TaxID=3242694 RepID=A0ABV4U098_9GAMM